MKKWLMLALALTISISFVGAAFAMDKGNKRKGKYIYRKVYKACHQRGEVDSAKPPINPDAKTATIPGPPAIFRVRIRDSLMIKSPPPDLSRKVANRINKKTYVDDIVAIIPKRPSSVKNIL